MALEIARLCNSAGKCRFHRSWQIALPLKNIRKPEMVDSRTPVQLDSLPCRDLCTIKVGQFGYEKPRQPEKIVGIDGLLHDIDRVLNSPPPLDGVALPHKRDARCEVDPVDLVKHPGLRMIAWPPMHHRLRCAREKCMRCR